MVKLTVHGPRTLEALDGELGADREDEVKKLVRIGWLAEKRDPAGPVTFRPTAHGSEHIESLMQKAFPGFLAERATNEAANHRTPDVKRDVKLVAAPRRAAAA